MTRVNAGIDKVLSVLAAVATVLMMLHVVAHALLRFFLNSPLYGTNEIVAYWYLPAIALLGIPAAHLQNEHITVTLVTERMGRIYKNILGLFVGAVCILVSMGFAFFGFEEAMEKMEMGATAGVTDIVTWPIYFLVPLTFVLLALLHAFDMYVIARTGDPDLDPITGEAIEDELVEGRTL